MYTMHEALAREHRASCTDRPAGTRWRASWPRRNRWHVLARRAHTVSRRHATGPTGWPRRCAAANVGGGTDASG